MPEQLLGDGLINNTMGLNISKGDMYDWVTHTWNPIKGRCYHDCSYCYMKRWGQLNPVHLDEKDLNTDLGKGNFIFVGSSCDMWAKDIPDEWINKVLEKCTDENKYLFQTKNPARLLDFPLCEFSVVCTTIETNRWYPEIMRNSPRPSERVDWIMEISNDKYITIEPIMDFDLHDLIGMMILIDPKQINIGADSGRNNLPEPSKEKLMELIAALRDSGMNVKEKSNLKRLLK